MKILEIDGRFAPAHFTLAVGYRMLGRMDLARKSLQTAKELGYPVDSETEAEFQDRR